MNRHIQQDAPSPGSEPAPRRYGLFGISASPRQASMDAARRQSMVRWINAVIVLTVIGVVLILVLFTSSGLTVTFDCQGGSAAPAQSVTFGGFATPPQDVVRPGYHLVGWSPTPDGSQPWDFDSDSVTEALTLYAIWEPQ